MEARLSHAAAGICVAISMDSSHVSCMHAMKAGTGIASKSDQIRLDLDDIITRCFSHSWHAARAFTERVARQLRVCLLQCQTGQFICFSTKHSTHHFSLFPCFFCILPVVGLLICENGKLFNSPSCGITANFIWSQSSVVYTSGHDDMIVCCPSSRPPLPPPPQPQLTNLRTLARRSTRLLRSTTSNMFLRQNDQDLRDRGRPTQTH